MSEYQNFSAEIEVNKLIVDIFRLNGALLTFGDHLVADLKLTSSKWQVLGVLNNCETPLAMPAIAFNMGLTRQGVRAILKPLLEDGLVSLSPNPLHKRSSHLRITPAGAKAYAQAMNRHAPFARQLSEKLSDRDLKQCRRVISALLGEVNQKISNEE